MGDYLKFDRMITPIVIQVYFWVVLAIVELVMLYWMFAGESGQQRLGGLIIFIVFPFVHRMLCEWIIIMFQINDKLHDIRENTKKG